MQPAANLAFLACLACLVALTWGQLPTDGKCGYFVPYEFPEKSFGLYRYMKEEQVWLLSESTNIKSVAPTAGATGKSLQLCKDNGYIVSNTNHLVKASTRVPASNTNAGYEFTAITGVAELNGFFTIKLTGVADTYLQVSDFRVIPSTIADAAAVTAALKSLAFKFVAEDKARINDWQRKEDSFKDGNGANVVGQKSVFEFFGLAFKDTCDATDHKVWFAVNANIDVNGQPVELAKDGIVNFGDLMVNFGPNDMKIEATEGTSKLYAVRFVPADKTSDSGAPVAGVLKNVRSKNVAPFNYGFKTYEQYHKQTEAINGNSAVEYGDILAPAVAGQFAYVYSYFPDARPVTGRDDPPMSVDNGYYSGYSNLQSGGSVSYIEATDAQAKPLVDAVAATWKGSKWVFFGVPRQDFPAGGGTFRASLFLECLNDAIVLKAELAPCPLPLPPCAVKKCVPALAPGNTECDYKAKLYAVMEQSGYYKLVTQSQVFPTAMDSEYKVLLEGNEDVRGRPIVLTNPSKREVFLVWGTTVYTVTESVAGTTVGTAYPLRRHESILTPLGNAADDLTITAAALNPCSQEIYVFLDNQGVGLVSAPTTGNGLVSLVAPMQSKIASFIWDFSGRFLYMLDSSEETQGKLYRMERHTGQVKQLCIGTKILADRTSALVSFQDGTLYAYTADFKGLLYPVHIAPCTAFVAQVDPIDNSKTVIQDAIGLVPAHIEFFPLHSMATVLTCDCIKCPDDCATCLTADRCETCPPGKYLTLDGKCVDTCPAPSSAHPFKKICVCGFCDAATGKCYECDTATSKCLVAVGTECKECDANCHTCTETPTKCTSCPPNQWLDKADRTCKPCAAPCLDCVDRADKCTRCPDGQVITKTGTCEPCNSCTCKFVKDRCLNCPDPQRVFDFKCTNACPTGTDNNDKYCCPTDRPFYNPVLKGCTPTPHWVDCYGRRFALLDGSDPKAPAAEVKGDLCQKTGLPLPEGWRLAPNNGETRSCINCQTYGTDCVVLADGTAWNPIGAECNAPSSGQLVTEEIGGVKMYRPASCNKRILIQWIDPLSEVASFTLVPPLFSFGAATPTNSLTNWRWLNPTQFDGKNEFVYDPEENAICVERGAGGAFYEIPKDRLRDLVDVKNLDYLTSGVHSLRVCASSRLDGVSNEIDSLYNSYSIRVNIFYADATLNEYEPYVAFDRNTMWHRKCLDVFPRQPLDVAQIQIALWYEPVRINAAGEVIGVPQEEITGRACFKDVDVQVPGIRNMVVNSGVDDERYMSNLQALGGYSDGWERLCPTTAADIAKMTRSPGCSIRMKNEVGHSSGIWYQHEFLPNEVNNGLVPRTYVMEAWCKATDVTGTPDYDFSIYVDVFYSDGTAKFGIYEPFPVGTYDEWHHAHKIFSVHEKDDTGKLKVPKRLVLSLLFREPHTGTVICDDLSLYPRDDTCYDVPPQTVVHGDPHLVTFDGLRFDVMSHGEFVLIKTNNFALHGRFQQVPLSAIASYNSGFAASFKDGAKVVVLSSTDQNKPDPQLFITRRTAAGAVTAIGLVTVGEIAALNGKNVALDNYGSLLRVDKPNAATSATYTFTFLDVAIPTEVYVVIITAERTNDNAVQFLRADATVPSGFGSFAVPANLQGMLGNYNGNPKDDLRKRNGDAFTLAADGFDSPPDLLDAVQFKNFYDKFPKEWAVTATDNSPFALIATKLPALSPASLVGNFPQKVQFTPAERAQAEAECVAAGVTPPFVPACVWDLLVTRNTATNVFQLGLARQAVVTVGGGAGAVTPNCAVPQCVKCEANNQKKCKQCAPGFAKLQDESACVLVSRCPNGESAVNGVCTQCTNQCTECALGDSAKCRKCTGNRFLRDEACVLEPACDTTPAGGAGFARKSETGNLCLPCDPVCKTCKNEATTCTSCNDALFLVRQTCQGGNCGAGGSVMCDVDGNNCECNCKEGWSNKFCSVCVIECPATHTRDLIQCLCIPPSSTPSPTPSETPSRSHSPTATMDASSTPTATPTPSISFSRTPSISVSSSPTPSVTAGQTPTATSTSTPTPTPTPSETRLVPVEELPEPSRTPPQGPPPSPEPGATASLSPSGTPSGTPTSTPRPIVVPVVPGLPPITVPEPEVVQGSCWGYSDCQECRSNRRCVWAGCQQTVIIDGDGNTNRTLVMLCAPIDVFNSENIEFVNECTVFNNCSAPVVTEDKLTAAPIIVGVAGGASFALGGSVLLIGTILMFKRWNKTPGSGALMLGDPANDATVTSGAFNAASPGGTENVLYGA
eukprot:CAMPEP_0177648056 /NCGR_PEP_ID=MMETSP0447-20121125/10627_1 /TAXON_ID=0 /ORGANISM="Stygamoeba regulata, Strain BSH-02190019" /LENGTH=2257 /DNA_ID=CAMNT_0019150677 /DNA_START=164 /DNA_END=6937 /DNA_ORIENTATION=-